jgi:hypothetical protein
VSIFAQTAAPSRQCLVTKDANKVSPKRETVMKEADLFQQYAKEASLEASSNLIAKHSPADHWQGDLNA